MKAYLVADKNGDIYIYRNKPERSGYKKVPNAHQYPYKTAEGIKYKTLYVSRNKSLEYVDVGGFIGTDMLWDSTHTYRIGEYTVEKSDCYKWCYRYGSDQHIQISEHICKKLFDRIPTWDDDPIEVEF